jgi:hypothetical protein
MIKGTPLIGAVHILRVEQSYMMLGTVSTSYFSIRNYITYEKKAKKLL